MIETNKIFKLKVKDEQKWEPINLKNDKGKDEEIKQEEVMIRQDNKQEQSFCL